MATDKKIEQLTPFANITDSNSLAEIALTFESGDYKCNLFQLASYAVIKSSANAIITPTNVTYNPTTRELTLTAAGGENVIYYWINGTKYSIQSPVSVSASDVSVDVRFDTYYLDPLGLFVSESTSYVPLIGASIIPIRLVNYINQTSDVWERESGFTVLVNSEQIQLFKSIQEKGTTLATANLLTLSGNGNYASMLDNTNDIKLISRYDSDGKLWQHGSAYDLYVLAGTTIKHNFSDTTTHARILVDATQDWTANNNTLIHMRYDGFIDAWVVQGTATGDILKDLTNIIAEKINAPAYELTTIGELVGWTIGELNGCSVDNMGTASVAINANEDGIDIGIGTIYGIDVLDSAGDRIAYFPCNENNAAKLILVDIVNQEEKFINGTKIVVPQSDLFLGQNYGVTFREDADNAGTFIQVNYSSDKIKMEIG